MGLIGSQEGGNPSYFSWTNGSSLAATVDVTDLSMVVNRRIYGIASHSLTLQHTDVTSTDCRPFRKNGSTMQWNVVESYDRSVASLNIPFSRIYGVIQEANSARWGSVENALSGGVLPMFAGMGLPPGQVSVVLQNINSTTTGSSNATLSGAILNANTYATHISTAYDLGFRWFEVENEPYSSSWGGSSRFPHTATGRADYAAWVRDVYTAAKNARPSANIGIPVAIDWQTNPTGSSWCFPLLTGTAAASGCSGYYDFIAIHQYMGSRVSYFSNMQNNSDTFERWTMAQCKRAIHFLMMIRSAVNNAYPIFITEWGCNGVSLDGSVLEDQNQRNGNIYGCIHMAHRLLLYQDAYQLYGQPYAACAWNLHKAWWSSLESTYTGTHYIASPWLPHRRGFPFWMFDLFRSFTGYYMLPVSGTAPIASYNDAYDVSRSGVMTPIQATLSRDGKTLFLIIINLTWGTDYSFSVNWSSGSFAATGYHAVLFKHDDKDHKGYLDGNTGNHTTDTSFLHPTGILVHPFSGTLASGSFSGTLPGHSILFVRISK